MAYLSNSEQLVSQSSCESICEDFERDFRCGVGLRIEDYLTRHPLAVGLGDNQLLLGLIHSDLELRLRRDESVELWQYIERFPEIADLQHELIILLRTEVRIRLQRKQRIATPYYKERYPSLPVDELLLDLGIGFPKVPGYEIVEEIGRGGMGVVYRARDITLHRDVAIKVVLHKAGASSAGSPFDRIERFRREATITGRLEHPGIPPIHAYGYLENGQPFIVMKLIRGKTLASLLKSRAKTTDNLLQMINHFESVAQAVGFAHSVGIVHRDLKPTNIMIGAFGEVQVMDWGLAKEVSSTEVFAYEESHEELSDSDPSTQLSHSGQIIGTPEYMAPEQARREEVDVRADVFGLGAILAAIITGHPVFAGSSAQDLISKAACGDISDVMRRLENVSLDKEIVTLAKDCLAATPTDRPSNGIAVAQRIAEYRAIVELRLRAAETEKSVAQFRLKQNLARKRIFHPLIAALLLGVFFSLLFSWRSSVVTVSILKNPSEKVVS